MSEHTAIAAAALAARIQRCHAIGATKSGRVIATFVGEETEAEKAWFALIEPAPEPTAECPKWLTQ